MLDVVASDPFGKLVDHPFDTIGVKTTLVEDLVSAVIALVGAAYATGVSEPSHAVGAGINAGICEMVSGRRQSVDVGDRAFRLVNYAFSAIFE